MCIRQRSKINDDSVSVEELHYIYIYIYLKGAYKYLNGAYYILKGYHSTDNCFSFVVFCPEINNKYILHSA